MDIFAAGCVLYELFADGKPLFDYSKVLAYRRLSRTPTPDATTTSGSGSGTTNEKDDTNDIFVCIRQLRSHDKESTSTTALDGISKVIMRMIARDPAARPSASECLNMYVNEVMRREDQGALMHVVAPWMGDMLGIDPEKRADVVGRGYWTAVKRKVMAGDEGVLPSSVAQHHELEVSPPPTASTSRPPTGTTKPSGVLSVDVGALLAEARSAITELGNTSTISTSTVSEGPKETTITTLPPTEKTTPKPQTMTPNDALIATLTLLCAVLRSSRHQSVRIRIIESIADCAVACGDDDARLQRAIPQLIAAATDHQFAAVRCAAVRAIPRVLSSISPASIPASEAPSFACYLLPSLSLLPADSEPSIQSAYADALSTIALHGMAGLETVARGGTQYEEEVERLRAAVERAVHDLLVGARPEPKVTLLPHLEELAEVLGRRDTADGLLPALLTLFNSREWEVRAALYGELGGVCPALGRQGVAFLLPFVDRMLSDPEPAAVAAATDLLSSLCKEGLLRQRHILSAAAKVVENGLLKAECTAVRAAAVRFVAAAAAALPPSAAHALLLPIFLPHLLREPAPMDSIVAIVGVLPITHGITGSSSSSSNTTQTMSTRQRHTIGSGGSNRIATTSSNSTQHPIITGPLTSYSVVLDPKHVRRATSHLTAALEQAGSVRPTTPPLQGGMGLMAAAQRTILIQNQGVQGAGALPPPPTTTTRLPPQQQQQQPLSTPTPILPSPRGVLVAHLAEHKRQITRMASFSSSLASSTSPYAPLFVTASDDGTVKLWDARRLERDIAFRPRASFGNTNGSSVKAVAALGDGTVVVGNADGRVVSFKVDRGPGGEGWGVHAVHTILHSTETNSSSVIDIQPLFSGGGGGSGGNAQSIVISRTGVDGVQAYDLRVHRSQCIWKLGSHPVRGAVTRVLTAAAATAAPPSVPLSTAEVEDWIVTGTSRGHLNLWDLRFLVPVSNWMHPKGVCVDALCYGGGGGGGGRGTPSASPPTVYAGMGKDEIVGWNAANGRVVQVLRMNASTGSGGNNNSGSEAGAVAVMAPEALAAPPPDLKQAMDPLARARQLGAVELRTLAARQPGVRALLRWSPSVVVSGSTDGAVRCWDVSRPENSYMMIAPPSDELVVPKWEYSRSVGGAGGSGGAVVVVDERSMAKGGGERREEQQEEVENRRVAGKWRERAAALCHESGVVDVVAVPTASGGEGLVVTGGADGVVKVWR